MKKGLNLGVPSPLAKLVTSSWKVISPPMPLAKMTPTLSTSTFSLLMFASATAISLAATAIWAKRSSFLASLLFIVLKGSNPFISQANRLLNLDASNAVIMSAPETPFINESQKSSKLLPIGVNAPIPVTTTRFNSIQL